MSIATETGSGVATLDASNLSYQFERVRINFPRIKTKEVLIEVNDKKAIPPNLTYLDDFYDPKTGTSGTAFEDKDNGQVVIAYTGTNPDVKGLEGKAAFAQDILTDVVAIGVGTGTHYQSAYRFYEKISKQYGSKQITLTGHSLGGNIAQRVALEYNAPKTVVYNAAPLYIPSTALVANGVSSMTNLVSGLLTTALTKNNIEDIKEDRANFTGQVTRITTADDPLNRYADKLGGVYLGEEYILKDSGGHSMDGIANDRKQITQVQAIMIANNDLSRAIQTTQSSLTRISKKKEELRLNDNGGAPATNGLTDSEQIYLDSAQASAAAEGISQVIDAGAELIEAQIKGAKQEAENLYDELDDVPWYFILTPDEMKAAYDDVGVNYQTIVEEISEHGESKKTAVNQLAAEFKELQNNIEQGIKTQVQEDQNVAALFGLS